MLWHPKGYSGIAFREESLDFTLFPKFAIFIFFCRRRRCSCCLQNPKVFRKNQNFSCPEKYFFGAKNFTSYYFAWKGSARRAQQWWAGRLVGRLIPLHYCKAFSPHHLRFLKATSPPRFRPELNAQDANASKIANLLNFLRDAFYVGGCGTKCSFWWACRDVAAS